VSLSLTFWLLWPKFDCCPQSFFFAGKCDVLGFFFYAVCFKPCLRLSLRPLRLNSFAYPNCSVDEVDAVKCSRPARLFPVFFRFHNNHRPFQFCVVFFQGECPSPALKSMEVKNSALHLLNDRIPSLFFFSAPARYPLYQFTVTPDSFSQIDREAAPFSFPLILFHVIQSGGPIFLFCNVDQRSEFPPFL